MFHVVVVCTVCTDKYSSFSGIRNIKLHITSSDKCSSPRVLLCILFLSVVVMAIIHLNYTIFILFESGQGHYFLSYVNRSASVDTM